MFLYDPQKISQFISEFPYSAGYPGIGEFVLFKTEDSKLREGDIIAIEKPLYKGLFAFEFYEVQTNQDGDLVVYTEEKDYLVGNEYRFIGGNPVDCYVLL